MSDADELERTRWDYVYYALWVLTVVFLGMWFVGWLGEQLGWWNDIGEVLVGVGRIAGLGLAAVTVLIGATRSQVRATNEAVQTTKDAVHETEDAVHETKDAVHETKDAVEANGAKLDQQTVILREIRDRL